MIDIGRMQLVTVDSDLKVVAGIDGRDGAWTRTSAPAQMGSYSNRVRVVDHVAGFAGQSSLCGPGEHLAVIVPVGLDRRIEKAMDQLFTEYSINYFTDRFACFKLLALTIFLILLMGI